MHSRKYDFIKICSTHLKVREEGEEEGGGRHGGGGDEEEDLLARPPHRRQRQERARQTQGQYHLHIKCFGWL